MKIGNTAENAIGSGRETIDALARWFADNVDGLGIGAIVATIIVGLMLVMRAIGQRMADADPDCTGWKGLIGNVLAKTKFFFMVAAATDIVITYAAVPARLGRLADIFFIIAFALQGAIWARELTLGLIGRRVGDDPGESAIGNAMSIIRVLVSVALFAIAIIVILDNLGVNVTALIAGFGIGGIAIGLAAQGVFSDLFAALAILFDRPFRRGDTIRYDASIGTVERIGLKTTRLRSLSGEQLVMANTKLLEREIHNLAEGHSRRTVLTFAVTYQTSPDLLERIPEIARGVVEARRGCTLVRCAITGFGASSIDFELLFDSATVEIDIVAADRTAIVVALMRAFAAQQIEFAYPTQTTFTAAPDGTMVMPYAPAPATAPASDVTDGKADARRKP